MNARNTCIAGLLLSALLISGCSTNPATGEQSFTAFMSPEKELEVGAEEHPKLLKEFGGTYDDRALSAYVTAIGKKLAAHSELPDLPFQFFVLNDDTVNAFALPGGYIYISRGLITLAEDEAEVAGVIAHEIGHVTARHSAQRYSTAVATNLGLTAAGIVGSVFGAPSGLNNLASFGAQAALQSYSRNQELQADLLGVRYMTRAGYDPAALTDFFAKLDAHSKLQAKKAGRSGDNFSIMSTHPRTTDRIAQARRLAETETPPNARRNRSLFLDQVDGMLFGEDPDEGFMKGDTFLHPKIGFQFDFPPDFQVKNGKTSVEGTDGKGTDIIFTMEAPKAATGVNDLVRYVRDEWSRRLNFRPENVEALSINGLDAATGTATVDTNRGARDIRLLAIRGNRDQIFRFVFLTERGVTDKMSLPLRKTTYSFKTLKPGEVEAKPPTIQVQRVPSGASVASMSEQLPFGKYNEDWFRALNLNVTSDGLAAGEKVKMVGN